MSKTKKSITHEELQMFYGSEEWYQHPLNRRVIYTTGVQYLAEEAKAYWLIDAIASYLNPNLPEMRRALRMDARFADLHFWRLDVNQETQEAILTARVDSGVSPAITQKIPYTDFPLSGVDIWAGFDGTRWTLYLPSEH